MAVIKIAKTSKEYFQFINTKGRVFIEVTNPQCIIHISKEHTAFFEIEYEDGGVRDYQGK